MKLRHNVALLDKPLFVVSRELQKSSYYTDGNGFEVIGSPELGLPSMTDIKYLWFFLSKIQHSESNVYVNSIYQILKELKLSISPANYNRIYTCIKKFAKIHYVFSSGKICIDENGKDISHLFLKNIGVIDGFTIKEGEVRIEFNQTFIDIMKNSFSKVVCFETLYKFESPIALRLYMLLIRLKYSNYLRISYEALEKKLGCVFNKNERRSIEKAFEEVKKIHNQNFLLVFCENVVLFKRGE